MVAKSSPIAEIADPQGPAINPSDQFNEGHQQISEWIGGDDDQVHPEIGLPNDLSGDESRRQNSDWVEVGAKRSKNQLA